MLAKFGIDAVEPCGVLKVRVMGGDPRPKIVEVLSIDSSTAAPTARSRKAKPEQRAIQERGTVRSCNTHNGYGFIARDRGGRDAFFHISWLERRGVVPLPEGQPVLMVVVKGPEGAKSYEHPADVTCPARGPNQ